MPIRAVLSVAALCALAVTLYVAGGDSREREGGLRLIVTHLPEGFSEETVARGFTLPTAFAFLPDGRILVAEKSGVVRVVENGEVQPQPFLDISPRVNDFYERGLLGIAADPDFAENGYVYLTYSYENDPGDFEGSKTGRLGRFTAEGGTASPDTEAVVLGTRVGRSCDEFPDGADCIPQDWNTHGVGAIHFAADGTMFLTLGEAAPWEFVDERAFRAQDLDTVAGKVLRVTTEGEGLPSNPFWNGDPDAARSKVWAYGVRNPYRFGLRPGTGVPYLGDVGWESREEISAAPAGANLGWPCYEGDIRPRGYSDSAICRELYAKGPGAVQAPLDAWSRPESGGSTAATGGAFYTGEDYPERYRGAFFYGDYGQGFIRFLRVDENDRLLSPPEQFGLTSTPVDIEVGPDGDLYYLSLLAGELRRIVYTGDAQPR